MMSRSRSHTICVTEAEVKGHASKFYHTVFRVDPQSALSTAVTDVMHIYGNACFVSQVADERKEETLFTSEEREVNVLLDLLQKPVHDISHMNRLYAERALRKYYPPCQEGSDDNSLTNPEFWSDAEVFTAVEDADLKDARIGRIFCAEGLQHVRIEHTLITPCDLTIFLLFIH